MNFRFPAIIIIGVSIAALIGYRCTALEYVPLFENDQVSISRVKIMAKEEIGLHYDKYPQVVVALQGGIITRLEADGSTTDVDFPTDKAVFRPAEGSEKMHKSVNNGSEPIELIIIQLKK